MSTARSYLLSHFQSSTFDIYTSVDIHAIVVYAALTGVSLLARDATRADPLVNASNHPDSVVFSRTELSRQGNHKSRCV